MTWQLQDAKNKFSEVVQLSVNKGPQIISRHGKDTAVVVSISDYQKWTAPKTRLIDALKGARFDQLAITRDTSSTGRGTSSWL